MHATEAVLLGYVLSFYYKAFYVEFDPLVWGKYDIGRYSINQALSRMNGCPDRSGRVGGEHRHIIRSAYPVLVLDSYQ